MKADILKLTALTLFLALLLAGAPMSFAAENTGDKTTGKDVVQKIDESAHAIGNYSAEQRDEALTSAKSVLADADARIDHFESEMSRN